MIFGHSDRSSRRPRKRIWRGASVAATRWPGEAKRAAAGASGPDTGCRKLRLERPSLGGQEPCVTADKIDLETEASDLYVMPAKPGFLLIAEYYRKEGKIELKLEPINF